MVSYLELVRKYLFDIFAIYILKEEETLIVDDVINKYLFAVVFKISKTCYNLRIIEY